jgi:hypothetical protein
MMGNVIEPFSSTGRFKPSFQPNASSFVFALTITGEFAHMLRKLMF